MKKAFTTIIVILMTINALATNVWDGSSEPWTNGSGTENDPYLIETAANLAYLAEKVNEGYQAVNQGVFKGQYFKMTDDLDLNNINWTPIGFVNTSLEGFYFAGNFNGNYHVIDNFKINTSDDVSALFAAGATGTIIRNLFITNGNITTTGTLAAGVVGGIAGDAILHQCSFSGTISVTNSGQYIGAAGVVCAAAENSIVSECSFSGTISVSNTNFLGAAGAGGVVGIAMNNALITQCYNTGTISASAMILSVAAGILAATLEENNVEISNCYNVGSLNASTKGGIFGMISPINPTKAVTDITVTNCYYLNTCGGTTNYGTSLTMTEMTSPEFVTMIDPEGHTYVVNEGGFPVLALTEFTILDASEITMTSAKLSAEIHEGLNTIVRVVFVYGDPNTITEVEVSLDEYVETYIEDLTPGTEYLYYIYIQYADGTQENSDIKAFTTTTDGMEELDNNMISIYPNPATNVIYIDNIEPQTVNIYSVDGRLVKTVENANVIDVMDLNEGLYLINIGNVIYKMIKR